MDWLKPETFAVRKKIEVPVKFDFKFPEKCVYCGGSKYTTIILTPSIVTRHGKQTTTRSIKISVPYCATHANESQQNKALMYGVSILASIIGGYLSYVLFTSLHEPVLLPLLSRLNSTGLVSFVVLVEFLLVGFIALFCGGLAPLFVSSYFSKFPFFNKSLVDTSPVSVTDFLGQGNKPDHALGLSTTLAIYFRDVVYFEFTNHEIADEFAILNGVYVEEKNSSLPKSSIIDKTQKDEENTKSGLATKVPTNNPNLVLCSNCGHTNFKGNTKCSKCVAPFVEEKIQKELKTATESNGLTPESQEDVISPNRSADEWCKEGNSLASNGQYNEAIACLEEALQIDPKHALSWFNMGLTLMNLERNPEAIKAFNTFIEYAPPQAQATHVPAAKGYIQMLSQ